MSCLLVIPAPEPVSPAVGLCAHLAILIIAPACIPSTLHNNPVLQNLTEAGAPPGRQAMGKQRQNSNDPDDARYWRSSLCLQTLTRLWNILAAYRTVQYSTYYQLLRQ